VSPDCCSDLHSDLCCIGKGIEAGIVFSHVCQYSLDILNLFCHSLGTDEFPTNSSVEASTLLPSSDSSPNATSMFRLPPARGKSDLELRRTRLIRWARDSPASIPSSEYLRLYRLQHELAARRLYQSRPAALPLPLLCSSHHLQLYCC
jgi:hypothetical protein